MSLPANMAAQAATGATTWVSCAKLRTRDGLVIALTEHDRPFSVDLGDGDGLVSYQPSDAVALSTGRLAADLSVDNRDISGVLDDARITEEDLHAGRYEGAEVVLFTVDWQDPTAGQKIELAGLVGEGETRAEGFLVEVRAWPVELGRNIAQSIGPQCRKSFGTRTAAEERPPNTPCGVDLDPPTWAASTAYAATLAGDRLVGDRVKPSTANGRWYACTTAGTSGASEPVWPSTIGATVSDGSVEWTTEQALAYEGTVTASPDRRQLTASGIAVATDFWARGWLEWLTGGNAARGVASPIATDDGAGGLVLYRPTILAIEAGDTFRVRAGCDRSQAACVAFSNWLNNNGFPYVPSKRL